MYELPDEDSARSYENKQHDFGKKETLITLVITHNISIFFWEIPFWKAVRPLEAFRQTLLPGNRNILLSHFIPRAGRLTHDILTCVYPFDKMTSAVTPISSATIWIDDVINNRDVLNAPNMMHVPWKAYQTLTCLPHDALAKRISHNHKLQFYLLKGRIIDSFFRAYYIVLSIFFVFFNFQEISYSILYIQKQIFI